ncbi:MAG: thioredoxin domain-containing protein [Betaproteobacteria bacterium]|nr:thioredoxin domain-containing protein [Betaproteobacteria bacterium]
MPNRLAGETSPYLQQHADNPVAWHPWGEEALALARAEDKPILLSIGYSACHWCHVMAHESFEDEAVAAIMNRLFVNIKVDREERPDLDQIYQTAHQMLTQRAGGWPLTMFLTPAGAPFFGGTYFPKSPRYGLPGFADLLERVAQTYSEKRAEIEAQNASLLEALADSLPRPGAATGFDAGPLTALREMLGRSFDAQHGGFGAAPKFPHPTDLAFLLRRAGDEAGREMALTTLRRMAEGGIYDQLGGGFCRYSTDAEWSIPHFEKMLYDNGPLLALYADAWAATGEPLFRAVAEQTAAWLMREMQAPADSNEGGYYSALDADSEGVEGKFYVWTREEISALLSPEEYALVARHWGLDDPANFEGTEGMEGTHWHLRVTAPLSGNTAALLEPIRARLFAARKTRIHPGRDEKILTSWNALAIQGMAHAARIFNRPDWLESARRALEFIRTRLWRKDRLLATSKDGRAHLDAYLDDHAFLLAALLELMQAEYRGEDMEFALALADALLENFEDSEQGGFFFTRHDHEALIHRPKPGHDNATPAGNGVAAVALQRLALLSGDARYAAAAERTLRLFQPQFARQPGGYATLLEALEEWLTPPRLVVLRGPTREVSGWQTRLAALNPPNTLTLALPNPLAGLPAALDKPVSDQVNAWVCSGVSCLAPVKHWPELVRILEAEDFG